MSAKKVLKSAKSLSDRVQALSFEPPVAYCYNPLEYAWEPFSAYVTQYAKPEVEAVMLGMNPGPFGMAQTGVPFGDIGFVRDWMQIEAVVGKPSEEHPKRPIQGFDCPRGEVSGQRLWGWAKERFVAPQDFFKRFFVWNYCPLCFMGESGKNLTPDKLPKEERERLFEICDQALREVVLALDAPMVIGIGKFALNRAEQAFASSKNATPECISILHPSPASPAANRGWKEQAEKQLLAAGFSL